MYKNILVAVDGSSTSNRALQEAMDFAKEQQACLLLVHVVDETLVNWDEGQWLNYGEVQEALTKSGEKILADTCKKVREAGIKATTKLVESTARRTSDVIVEESQRQCADLIVIGTHGRRGFDRLLLGSVAEGVTRTATVPVLLVRGS